MEQNQKRCKLKITFHQFVNIYTFLLPIQYLQIVEDTTTAWEKEKKGSVSSQVIFICNGTPTYSYIYDEMHLEIFKF